MAAFVYRYIWDITGRQQILLCLLAGGVVALSAIPLELQRRIVNDAFGAKDLHLFVWYCGLYFTLLLLQGGIKYTLNVMRGWTVEKVSRLMRLKIFAFLTRARGAGKASTSGGVSRGATVSMISSEAEDLAGFVGDSVSTPLVQGGTTLVVFGYLLWVNPLLAGFAVVLYLPQVLIVPPTQRGINRNAVNYAKVIRKAGDIIVGLEHPEAENGKAGGHFRRLVDQGFSLRTRSYRLKFLLTALGNLLDALGPLVVLGIGGVMAVRGHLPLGTIVVFISGLQKIADPWDQLITFYRSASNAQAKYQLLRQTLAEDRPAEA
jgi:ABC-type multidrug transport system fused ATPase/permease subunit